MRKYTLFLTAIAVLTLSVAAFAFGGHCRHHEKHLMGGGCFAPMFIDKHVEHLSEALDLTSQQRDQVTQLFEECSGEFFAARENAAEPEELIEIGLSLKQKIDARMMEILGEEQQNAFLEFREDHFRHGAGPHCGRHVRMMTAALDLSPEQEQDLMRIMQTARQDFCDRVQGEPDAGMIHDHFREVDQQIQAILDEEQLKKYENMKGLFHEHMGL